MADTVSIGDVRVVRETHEGETELGALLVEIDGEEKWVPKSVIDDDSEVYEKDQDGTLIIAGWWARKNGLE